MSQTSIHVMIIFVGGSSFQVIDKPPWEDFPLQCMNIVSLKQGLPKKKKWKGNVLWMPGNHISWQEIVSRLLLVKRTKFCHVVCVAQNRASFYQQMVDELRVVEAAGGLVRKKNAYLFIGRKGYWDLPKGKVARKESIQHAAVREVKEECNISVDLREKICHTLHLTTPKGGPVFLKRVHWYVMDCVDDNYMSPCLQEGIERLLWVEDGHLKKIFKKAHPSIVHVIRSYDLLR